VLAKCGELVGWHWAHERAADCDPWAEPDTRWHAWWQLQVPPECREVPMGPHRADIVTPRGSVVELQSSALPESEVAEREAFYGPDMVWLFDVRSSYELDLRKNKNNDSRYRTFRWKRARKSVALPRLPVFLDIGVYVLELRRIHRGPPCGGWGRLWRKDEVVEALNRSG
jgi:hypothetical protein